MPDETQSLINTLVVIIAGINACSQSERVRVANAFLSGRTLAASIALDKGDARPRIIACFDVYHTTKAGGDVACTGWLLAAVQERVNEHNLPQCQHLQDGIDKALELLSLPRKSLH